MQYTIGIYIPNSHFHNMQSGGVIYMYKTNIMPHIFM